MRFDQSLSHTNAKKKTKRLKDSNFALLLVVLKGRHGSERVQIDAHERKRWQSAENEAKWVFFKDIMQLATEILNL